jgi:hypothetical protein
MNPTQEQVNVSGDRDNDSQKSCGENGSFIELNCETEPELNGLTYDFKDHVLWLWNKNVTLRWKLNLTNVNESATIKYFKQVFRADLSDAINAWGDASPVKFQEVVQNQGSHFEVVFYDNICSAPNKCYHALAFTPSFPADKLELRISNTFVKLSKKLRLRILSHEIGHIFGLRHSDAANTEPSSPAVVIGRDDSKSIMSLDADAKVTRKDRDNLKAVYRQAWSGNPDPIRGVRVRLVSV